MSLREGRGGTAVDLSGSVPARVYSDIEAYYSARVAQYGATPMGVDWSCQATQSLRFVQLLKVCDFSAAFSLNDIGCGYGALAAFLAVRHPKSKIDYLGVDLSRAMIERARRRHSGSGSPLHHQDDGISNRRLFRRQRDHERQPRPFARDLGGVCCPNLVADATHESSRFQRQFFCRHDGSRDAGGSIR